MEAIQNIESLKNLLNKQRVQRKNVEDDAASLAQFNLKSFFVIVSVNPNSF